jgi:ribonuclease-3
VGPVRPPREQMQGKLEDLEAAIGYQFKDRGLLIRALTHYSHVYQELGPDAPRTARNDNQQLEFLGDSILGLIVSERVFTDYPDHSEGKLHLLKARLVSESHLFEIARNLDLGHYLFLGRGEELSGGRLRRAMLADALEALIAAIFLDSGLTPASEFIRTHVIGESCGEIQTDYKTSLLTLIRERQWPPPTYEVVAETGPAHARLFTVEVRVEDKCSAKADGSSKKSASQAAARAIVEILQKPAS